MLTFIERALVFFPMKYPQGEWNKPSSYIEDANFTAADGTKLHGWCIKEEHPRAVILVAHGNAGNVTHRAELLISLNEELRATALVFDYRGFGRSAGKPDEPGILQDARAARAWLARKAEVAEEEVILMGESLGTGVVVDLAANDGARGIILQSAFTSLPEVARRFYPWLPVRWLMQTRLDSLSKIGRYAGPLLQFHGADDEVVPLECGKQLFNAAPTKNKLWYVLSGAMHNSVRPAAFYEVIRNWLRALP